MIYFIGADRRGSPVKIGEKHGDVDWKKFMSQLQRGNPERLFLLNLYQGVAGERSRHFEGGVHLVFGHARMVGEWFDPWRDVRLEHLACTRSELTASCIWQEVYGAVRTWDDLPQRVKRNQGDWLLREMPLARGRTVKEPALRAMYRAYPDDPRRRLVKRAGPECNWYRR